MFVLGIDPGWRNTGMCMIEWMQRYDTLSPLAQWVDDLLGDRKYSIHTTSAILMQLLIEWLEKRKDVFEMADMIVIEWQKDRKLNMMIPFLQGAFPNKVVYYSKRTAHVVHEVPISNSNSRNKEKVMDYMKHFLDTCPDSYFAPGVEKHHSADAAFLATAYCIQEMGDKQDLEFDDSFLPGYQAGNPHSYPRLSCMTKWLPDCVS